MPPGHFLLAEGGGVTGSGKAASPGRGGGTTGPFTTLTFPGMRELGGVSPSGCEGGGAIIIYAYLSRSLGLPALCHGFPRMDQMTGDT